MNDRMNASIHGIGHNDAPLDSLQTNTIHIPSALTHERHLLHQALGLGDLLKQAVEDALLLLIHEVVRLAYQYGKGEARDGEEVLNELR